MVSRVFVEGGGHGALDAACRQAFHDVFERAGLRRKPRVIVCGSRAEAYRQFCIARREGESSALLLVDAEDVVGPPATSSPWKHVASRKGDGWTQPDGATDADLHFMAVCMETWLLADPDAMRAHFDRRFDPSGLPPASASLESHPKEAVLAFIVAASSSRGRRGAYEKREAFQILKRVDPARLRALPWAARFLDTVAAPTA